MRVLAGVVALIVGLSGLFWSTFWAAPLPMPSPLADTDVAAGVGAVGDGGLRAADGRHASDRRVRLPRRIVLRRKRDFAMTAVLVKHPER